LGTRFWGLFSFDTKGASFFGKKLGKKLVSWVRCAKCLFCVNPLSLFLLTLKAQKKKLSKRKRRIRRATRPPPRELFEKSSAKTLLHGCGALSDYKKMTDRF
jgi:hypothetical protein